MKFLVFNAVVAAALFYLFTADRDELHATADRVYDGARAIEGTVESFAEEHEQLLLAREAPIEPIAPDRPETRVEAPRPALIETETQSAPPVTSAPTMVRDAAPASDPAAPPPAADREVSETVAALREPAPEPAVGAPKRLEPLPERTIEEMPVHAVPGAPGLGDLPPVSDPDVARRRAEVLEGIATPAASPAVVIPEGEELMSPNERLRALYDLAEEMELLAVTKIHR